MFKYGRASANTNQAGLVELAIKIPGEFAGLQSGSPAFSGRIFFQGELWFGTGSQGDYVLAFTVEDRDGVIPVPMQAAFPNYPIIASRQDGALSSENQGLFLAPNMRMQLVPAREGSVAVPSGLYVCITAQKAGEDLEDTLYANFGWDDLT